MASLLVYFLDQNTQLALPSGLTVNIYPPALPQIPSNLVSTATTDANGAALLSLQPLTSYIAVFVGTGAPTYTYTFTTNSIGQTVGPFVDTVSTQTINGAKTFSVQPVAPNGIVDTTTSQNIAGVKAFTSAPSVPAQAFPGTAIVNGGIGSTQLARADQLTQVGWFSVKDYGAKGDGTTDDTAAIQLAAAAVPTGGVLYFPAGTYIVSLTSSSYTNGYQESWAIALPNAQCHIVGAGRGTSIVKFSATSYQASSSTQAICVMFGIGGPQANVAAGGNGGNPTVAGATQSFRSITLDGNGQNQTFGTLNTAAKFLPFFAVGSHTSGTAVNSKLVCIDAEFNNWTMALQGVNKFGRAIENFGFDSTFISNCNSKNTDTFLWHTTAFAQTTERAVVENVDIVNAYQVGIYLESTGNINASNVNVTANSTSVGGDGVRVFMASTTSVVKNVNFANVNVVNGQYVLTVGFGAPPSAPPYGRVSDSVFANFTGTGCAGGVVTGPADSTTIFRHFTLDGCANGGVRWTGFTTQGSLEVNVGTSQTTIPSFDFPNLASMVIKNSQNNGIAIGGPFVLDGGDVTGTIGGKNPVTFVGGLTAWPTTNLSRLSRLRGYMPVGNVTPGNIGGSSPFPATGVVTTNNYPFDVEIYFQNTNGSLTASKNGTGISVTSFGLIRLGPQETISFSYGTGGSSAWQWFGSNT